MKLRLKIPATCANLGPGFDTLGLALNIYNIIDVEYTLSDECKCEHTILHNGEEIRVDTDVTIIAYNIVSELFKDENKEEKYLCRIVTDVHIPMERGLGSSSAAFCAGAFAALYMAAPDIYQKGHFSDDALLTVCQLCCEYDGHSDNALACIYGGLQCYTENLPRNSIQLRISDKLRIGIIIPNYRCSTSQSRLALPDAYSRSTVIKQLQSLTCVLQGMQTGSVKMLQNGFRQESLHVPYRKSMNPLYEEVDELISENEIAVAHTLSGSGSTLIVVGNSDESIQSLFDLILSQKTKSKIDHDSPHRGDVAELELNLVNISSGIICDM